MNCSDFGGRWNAHVAGVLEPPDETQMLEHSRACDACGTKWREHEELTVLLGSVIGPLKRPDHFAPRLVDRLPPASVHRTALRNRDPSAPEPLPENIGPMLLAAFLGGVVMYLMSGAAGGSAIERLIYAEMLGRSLGRGGLPALAFDASDLVRLLLALAFLVWITRASFWGVLFPIRLPRGLLLARWLAIPTILVGGLRLLLALWLYVLTWSNMMWQGRIADISIWLGTSQFLDQIWTLAFWLTLLALLFGVLNEITLRYARPLQ